MARPSILLKPYEPAFADRFRALRPLDSPPTFPGDAGRRHLVVAMPGVDFAGLAEFYMAAPGRPLLLLWLAAPIARGARAIMDYDVDAGGHLRAGEVSLLVDALNSCIERQALTFVGVRKRPRAHGS